MDNTLELFDYSSPFGTWKGLLFKQKLVYFNKSSEEEVRLFARSKNFVIQKTSIPAKLQKELDLYFQGKLQKFNYPLHFLDGTDFEQSVWKCLLSIPYGETQSYAWVAQKIKNPRAIRAVGRANGKNRIPILIPCHRVINANGKLGGYSAGLDLKKSLLKIEGLHF